MFLYGSLKAKYVTISILHLPNGWTDQELGSAQLECNFEPAT